MEIRYAALAMDDALTVGHQNWKTRIVSEYLVANGEQESVGRGNYLRCDESISKYYSIKNIARR